MRELDTRVGELEKQLVSMAKADEDCTRLMRIPGVGVLTATAVTAHMGNARHFKNGRQFAACLGLTPREYSSGGKQKLLGISKRGNAYIRKLLIQGARSLWLFWQYKQPQEDRRAQWMQEVAMRRGKFVAIVAQANKTARILWNVLAKSEEYRQDYSIA
ncbi:IS110 family transposase [uncultured Mailhella sp.]|uniref:IS110 family transposase n=1 Tax=uncultured Mailhella sp. TaxID=1981031 RepID=UPI00344F70C0